MTRLASLLCTLACLGAPLTFAARAADAADAPPQRLVSVSGAGEVKAQPDMAHVTIGVEARKATVDEARAQVNATVERVLALTKELKIDPKYVDSTRLQVQPDYRWDDKTQRQVLQGYLVNRQIEVEVRDLERLGTLLEKAVSAGANQVGGARLDSSRRKELERQALALAVEDARLNAETLAQAAGMKLGPVQSLSASSSSPMPKFAERAMVAAAPPMADAADQTYKPAEMEFNANVSAQYELRLP